MTPLTFVDEFWKEPEHAAVVGIRSLSDGREIRAQEPIKPWGRINWKEVKAGLAATLNEKMKAAGIAAKPYSSWSARTAPK